MGAPLDRAVAVTLSVLVIALGFFPWVNWIQGGHEAEWYGIVVTDWMNGGAIAVGGGLVLAILARRLPLWREGTLQGVWARYEQHPGLFILGIAGLAGVIYGLVAIVLLGGRPLLIDEIVQVFQARIFADGRLWQSASAHPEFFSSMHVIDAGGRVYGQFPAGGPAMLALGTLLGSEWLVGPLCATLSVMAYGRLIRRVDERAGVRLGATVLFALAPFTMFLAGSHMNHVTSLMWLLVAVAALAAGMTDTRPRVLLALGAGLAFGMAGTVRPADALAFALPAGVWYLGRAIRHPNRWRDALAAAVGVAIPTAALLWINAHTTGAPLLFGYTVLWGDAHALGFHAAPWGDYHTPLRGLELINLYFLRLQTYLFETPFPSLMPAALALLLSRRLNAMDRYLMVSGTLLVGLYFAYWHDGFYIGPRFMYPLIPVLVLWTARLPGLVRQRFGEGLAYRTTVYTYGIGLVIAVAVSIPLRARMYAGGMLSSRWNAALAAEEAGVQNALVLVRESWGAQLIARLWALGITRPQAAMLYLASDRCELEYGILAAERSGNRGPEVFATLLPLVGDSARLVRAAFSEDPTARVLPGTRYTALCQQRVREEQAGFTVFAPLLLADGGGNIYARDLHARDTLLLSAYPDRDIYLLQPPTTQVGVAPRYALLSRDSLEQVWAVPPLP